MAMWGMGTERQEGPAREGRKVPEACTTAALLRLLETLDLKEGATSAEKGPCHREVLSRLPTHSPWSPGNAPAPRASVYPSVAYLGGVTRRTNSAPRKGNWAGSAPRKETGKLPQMNVKFFFRVFFP